MVKGLRNYHGKYLLKLVFASVFFFSSGILVQNVFADQSVTMSLGSGTSANTPCVTSNNCYMPNAVNVSPGETVTWTNTDFFPHTVTSGKPTDSTSGTLFDSNILSSGDTFSHTFTASDVGAINYFCILHPWMTGQVIVTLPSIPEFPFSFNLIIIFVVVAAVYMVIRQKTITHYLTGRT